MLKYVIPIWDLIEENSTHDFFFFFSFCFKFGKEVTKKLKRMISVDWVGSKLATPHWRLV